MADARLRLFVVRTSVRNILRTEVRTTNWDAPIAPDPKLPIIWYDRSI
ncbi:MAG: hypothetical protein MUE44_21395 [Oscillatoriaceae cyanobacterium Prado104]|nr:hypothetical protein [Oscillatoriaceae cyanobacterium Prado104]